MRSDTQGFRTVADARACSLSGFFRDGFETLTPEESRGSAEEAFDGPEYLGEEPEEKDQEYNQDDRDDDGGEYGQQYADYGDRVFDKREDSIGDRFG